VRCQLLQCVGVFAQLIYSVGEHRGMTHGERFQLAERRYSTFNTHRPSQFEPRESFCQTDVQQDFEIL
jgi:hypothetical protein